MRSRPSPTAFSIPIPIAIRTAMAALDREEKKTAIRILNELIADAWASLDDTEIAQIIEMKTRAVIEEI